MAWRNGNLGLAAGRGFFVLDVDPRDGGGDSFDRLIRENGPLPETAEVRTVGGGKHNLFRVEPGREAHKSILADGLDIIGDGGMIVVQPSIHPTTGEEYTWLRHPAKGIADAPAWLLERLHFPEEGTLPKPRAKGSPSRKTAIKPKPKRIPAMDAARMPYKGRRRGEKKTLMIRMMAKYPIPGIGRRHVLMVKVVGSLMGPGYADKEGFAIAHGPEWHCERCRPVRPDHRQRRLLTIPVLMLQAGPARPTCRRVKPIGELL